MEQAKLILYLILHPGATRKKMLQAVQNFNAKMKKLHPDKHKAFTLKGSHTPTIFALVDIFYEHCKTNKRENADPERIMWITRGLLVDKTGASSATIGRHINRLIDAGIILSRTKHGSKCPSDFVLNPKFLVPYDCPENSLKLAEMGKSVNPCFSYGSTAYISVCAPTASSGFPQEAIKFKIGNKVVDNVSQLGEKEHATVVESNQSSGSVDIATGLITTRGFPQVQGAQEAAGGPKKVAPKKVNQYMINAYFFLLQILYKGKSFSKEEHALAFDFLGLYFDGLKDQNSAYIQFLERVTFRRYLLDKDPGAFIPSPAIYLNPANQWGFAWTKERYTKIKEKRRENADYYSNMRKFIDYYREYSTSVNKLEVFKKAEAGLGRVRDGKKLRDMFYQVVLNPQDFENQINNYKNIHANS